LLVCSVEVSKADAVADWMTAKCVCRIWPVGQAASWPPAMLIMLSTLVRAATPSLPADTIALDEMDDISAWTTAISENASASVHDARGLEGGALVLEFDLAKTAGYVAARRPLAVTFPDDFELTFWMRGESGRNNLELKFIDASGDNVWWYRRANFSFSGDWQQVRVKRRQIDFAWGPTEVKQLRGIASIEFTIASGRDGGKGSLWVDQLRLKTVVRPTMLAAPRLQSATSAGRNGAALAMDGRTNTAWRSAPNGAPQTLTIDMQQVREFGGIELDWVRDAYASRYTIETSLDARTWTIVRTVTAGNGGRDSHWLPESEARYLRFTIPETRRPIGISEVYVRDLEFGASANAFITELAKRSRRGCYPRPYYGEQLYWTIVGVDGDDEESLISEDGAVEVRREGFSIEPFVRVDEKLLTWADVTLEQSLASRYLPVPSVTWKSSAIELTTTADSVGERGSAWTRVTYRLRNPLGKAQSVSLALAVRPLQVNPPTQFLNTPGGVTQLRSVAWQDGAVVVDGLKSVFPQQSPAGFTAAPLDADSPCEWLSASTRAASVQDDTGFASGALLYDVSLAAHGESTITLDLPLHPDAQVTSNTVRDLPAGDATWEEKLNRVELDLPAEAQPLADTLRTALAHVLINRDGAALQPGSRAYERSWIRDGALTSELLLRLGHPEVVKEFIYWYAGYQFSNGKTPCCVDVRGADPVPENDSPGEFLYLIDMFHRYTGDADVAKEMWPRALKAAEFMEKLRLSERTPENQQAERRAFYGLMPASISHEGYSAKPMHSYWDDFWALLGYESIIRIARTAGEREEATKWIRSRDEFRSDLYRSLNIAMRAHKIGYLPGSAELGDFDATSTTIALSPVGEQQMLPPAALDGTFTRYWSEFDKRRKSTTWDAYTPYEWRTVGAYIRLARRDLAQEALAFFMNDRRPAAWNQWAEVVGREARKPRFIGDMPHGWVASDFGRSILDMLEYERPADETVVLMAGVPAEWVRKEGFAVKNLRTPYGPLSYSVKVEAGKRTIEIGPLAKFPLGGIAIAWPPGEPTGKQAMEQGTGRWINGELRVQSVPFRVTFISGEAVKQ
jgi:hypothetical protein